MLIEHWRFFTTQILEIQIALKEQAVKDRELVSVYRSVPGIGLITSRTLAIESRDFSNLKTREHSSFKLALRHASTRLENISVEVYQ